MDKILSEKIGRYEVIRVLGRGDIGEMILAEDQSLRRKVTIKRLIRPSVASDLARFQVEVKAAAFRHPNMPVVYEMGMHDDLPFIAMEFVEGETLESIIESKREINLIAKLKIIEQVCTALGYAHRNGIVYGGLTPENIVVQANGVVKIVDFGIAKAQEGDVNAGAIDARVDLRSAGAALYKFVTSKDRHTTRKLSAAYGIVNNTQSSSGAALQDLPPALAQVVRESLAENADSHYQTGEQFAEALHKVVIDLSDARVMELLKDAEQLMVERRFEAALELFDEAIRLAPSNAAVRKRRKSVRAHHEQIRRAERIRECLRRGDDSLLSGDFEKSLSHLKDARNLDPHSEAIEAKIQSVEKERSRSESCARALEESERVKALGDFVGALRITAEALEQDPTNQELLDAHAAFATQKEMEVRRGRFLELVDQAERHLEAGNYDAASNLLNEAAEIDPSNQRAEKIRWELAKARGMEQRRAFLDDIQERIRDLCKNDTYEQASGLVNRALESFPDEMLLHRLKAEVDAEERRFDVRQVVDLVIGEVDDLFAHSPLEAMSVLEKALDNMPDEARLIKHERVLRQRMESRKFERSTGARF